MEQSEMRNNATIYDLLKQDHKDVKKLFKQILDQNRYQNNVYMQIKNALSVHIASEEKVFYNRLADNSETRQLVLSALEEHDVGRKVISDIDNSTEDDVKLAKIKVLNEAINEHIKQEEDDLFKRAKKVLSDDEGREIGRQFINEKMQSMPKMSSMPNL